MTLHSKKGAGGKRENSGRKTNYVTRDIKISTEHNEIIKAKFGRSFNQMVRDWISTII